MVVIRLILEDKVIGINTAKIGKSGVEGLGFSIPINEVLDKLDNLTKPISKRTRNYLHKS